jgi:hypothetical protein
MTGLFDQVANGFMRHMHLSSAPLQALGATHVVAETSPELAGGVRGYLDTVMNAVSAHTHVLFETGMPMGPSVALVLNRVNGSEETPVELARHLQTEIACIRAFLNTHVHKIGEDFTEASVVPALIDDTALKAFAGGEDMPAEAPAAVRKGHEIQKNYVWDQTGPYAARNAEQTAQTADRKQGLNEQIRNRGGGSKPGR